MKKIFIIIMIISVVTTSLSYACTKSDKTTSNINESGEETADSTVNKAPDFTLEDIQGQQLSLKDFRGKFVVLDFWGTWCPWCIKGIPDMKRYYNKYNGKFEIISIDCNDSKDKWKNAVRNYDMPWKHVYNTKVSSILSDYKIQGFPTKIIISPRGSIIKTVIGESPEFYDFLDKLFEK